MRAVPTQYGRAFETAHISRRAIRMSGLTLTFSSGLGSSRSSTGTACCDSFFNIQMSKHSKRFWVSQQTRPLVAERNPHISLCFPDIRARNGQLTRFTTRITPAYFGRYIRASFTSSRFLVHYALGGVGSLTPTLRLRCRSGVFHRRAAPPRSPLRARLSSWSAARFLMSSRLSPCPGSAASRR